MSNVDRLGRESNEGIVDKELVAACRPRVIVVMGCISRKGKSCILGKPSVGMKSSSDKVVAAFVLGVERHIGVEDQVPADALPEPDAVSCALIRQ